MGRFKRRALGYSRREVDSAMAAYDLRVSQLEQEIEAANRRAEEAEASGSDPAQLAMVAERIEEIQAQARGQATRIRMLALREASEVNRRVRDLAGRAQASGSGDGHAGLAVVPPHTGHEYREAVHLDVGPLRDFSQLTDLQDAVERIPAVTRVEIEGVAGGRATISVRLAEPVDLLTELGRLAPGDAHIRHVGPDRLLIDLDRAAGPERRAA